MKLELGWALASLLFLWTAIFQSDAQAQLTVSNFQLTPTSVVFDLSGTTPTTAPAFAAEALAFVNPDESASPGFALGDFLPSVTNGFSGTQQLFNDLSASPGSIFTGGPQFGDYFVVLFENPLTIGEAVDGRVIATWDSPAFDPAAISTLELYWGAEDQLLLTSGVLVDTVVVGVPEPATTTTIWTLLAGIATIRRRRLY